MIFIQTPEPVIEDSYGRAICVVADENGDAVPDFVVADGRTRQREIVVDLRSGKTQRRLWRATIKSADVDCITLVPTGDMNGDGRADVILSAWWVSTIHVLSGADGAVIRTFESASNTAWKWAYGMNVCTSDFDLDGTPDVAIDGGDSCATMCRAHVYLRSGKDGSLLHDIDLGEVRIAEMESGFDFDGDRTPDLAILATDWSKADATEPARTVVIVSGKTGKQLRVYPWVTSDAPQAPLVRKPNLPRLVWLEHNMRDGRECAQVVRFMPDEKGNARQRLPIEDCVPHQAVFAMSPDLDGDGVEDLLRGNHEAAPYFSGEVSAYSGKDAQLLWKLAGSNDLGASVASGIDFDGDKVPDVLAGAVHLRGQEHNGSVWAISGKTGKQLWTLDRDSP